MGISRLGDWREDLISVTARLESGLVASHLVNWLSPFKERKFVILGEQGALEIDSLTSDVTYFANGSVPLDWEYLANMRGVAEGEITRFSFPKPEPLRTEHEAFRDYILGIDENVVSLDTAYCVVQVAEDIRRSVDASSVHESAESNQ